MSPAQSEKRKGRKALGRGLGALIPEKTQVDPSSVVDAPIDRIDPSPFQPRKNFDEAAIADLASSIREHGVIQPLIVRRQGERYQLIAGERRWRAAKKAGLRSVPVILRDEPKNEGALAIALIENVQREDLNPIEEASAYEQLHDEFGLTQEEISRRVGKERSTVANALRLLKLPASVQSMVAGHELSMGHARALLAISSVKEQQKLAERIVRDGLSVRQVESLVSPGVSPKRKKTAEKRKDVFTRDAEEKLTRALRTKVEIERRRRGGVIRLTFSGEDDLIRLYEDLMGRRRA